VVQNHLLQVISNVAMEPPPRSADSETVREEKVKVLKGMRALTPDDVVRGQFEGYRDEQGVAPDSRVETYAALSLGIDSWRWQGVPFVVRAGKCLPMTRTEVVVKLRCPPAIVEGACLPANHLRFRLGPDFAVALGAAILGPDDGARPVELELAHDTHGEPEAYEELLGDAVRGDTFRFARQDYVEEAWRVVDPVLAADTPLHTYARGTWGPPEAEALVPGGWFVADDDEPTGEPGAGDRAGSARP
jgi:glucose-6-phosphate 1-dehydrogenase